MDEIIEFSNVLRRNGLPVSVRSTKDAYKSKKLLKSNGDDVLRSALRSIYVKDISHISKFNKAFDETFKNIKKEKEKETPSQNKKNKRHNKIIGKKFKILKPNKKEEKKGYLELNGIPPLNDFDPISTDDEFLTKDITKLNAFTPEILDLCQKLGRKIANKRSKRKYKSNNLKPDIRKTMRKNLKYGGVPIDLVRVKPKIKKNEHFFLNDVSGSCEWISTWFFSIVYSAKSSFKRSRTFDFDNKTIETTDALNESQLLNAFISVRQMRQRSLMIHGKSNMYTAFKSFDEMLNINKKTYVIILSDCRDWAGPKENGIPKSAEVIEKISKKAKKVLILNPEEKHKWNVVDSCVEEYEDAGAKFFEVRNLNQLADFIVNL